MSFMYKSMVSRAPGKRKIKIQEENILRLIQDEGEDEDEEDDQDFEIIGSNDTEQSGSDDSSNSNCEKESDDGSSDETFTGFISEQSQRRTSQVPGTSADLPSTSKGDHLKHDYEIPTVERARSFVKSGHKSNFTESHLKLQKQWQALSKTVKKIANPSSESCCICLNVKPRQPVMICQKCGIAVHKSCYKVLPGFHQQKTWFCDSCYRDCPKECEFCPSTEGCLRETSTGMWCHVICARYVLGDDMLNDRGLIDFSNLNTRRYGWKECSLCDDSLMTKTGICVKCDAGLCKSFFHVTCAQKYGLLSENENNLDCDTDPFFVYCPAHLTKENMTRATKKYISTFGTIELRAAQYDGSREHISKTAYHNRPHYVPPPQPRGDPPHRQITTNAAAMRLLNQKAEKMFNIDTRSPFTFYPRPSEVRRAQRVPPTLTPQFASHFADRELRIDETRERLRQSEEEHKQLTETEQKLRKDYETLQKALEGKQALEQGHLNKSQQLFSMCVSLKKWAQENRKSKSSHPTKLQLMPTSFVKFLKQSPRKRPSKEKSPEKSAKSSRSTHTLLNSCDICKSNHDQHLLIDCEVCLKWFHLACLDPPLTQMPRKSKFSLWQCSECAPSSDSDSDDITRGSDVTAEGRRVTRRSHRPPDKLESTETFSSNDILQQKRMMSYYSRTIRKTKHSQRQRIMRQLKKQRATFMSMNSELKKLTTPQDSFPNSLSSRFLKFRRQQQSLANNNESTPLSSKVASRIPSPPKSTEKRPRENISAETTPERPTENIFVKTSPKRSIASFLTSGHSSKAKHVPPKHTFTKDKEISSKHLTSPVSPPKNTNTTKSLYSPPMKKVRSSGNLSPNKLQSHVRKRSRESQSSSEKPSVKSPPKSLSIEAVKSKTFTVPLTDFKTQVKSALDMPVQQLARKNYSLILPTHSSILSKTDLLAALGKLMTSEKHPGQSPIVKIQNETFQNSKTTRKPIILSPNVKRKKKVLSPGKAKGTSSKSEIPLKSAKFVNKNFSAQKDKAVVETGHKFNFSAQKDKAVVETGHKLNFSTQKDKAVVETGHKLNFSTQKDKAVVETGHKLNFSAPKEKAVVETGHKLKVCASPRATSVLPCSSAGSTPDKASTSTSSAVLSAVTSPETTQTRTTSDTKSAKDTAVPCKVCHVFASSRNMLLCSLCKEYTHAHCCNPPLKSVPRSYRFCRWECSDCSLDPGEDSHNEEEPGGLEQTPDGRKRITRKRKPPEKFFYMMNSPDQKRIENAIKRRRSASKRKVVARKKISSMSDRKSVKLEVSSTDESDATFQNKAPVKLPTIAKATSTGMTSPVNHRAKNVSRISSDAVATVTGLKSKNVTFLSNLIPMTTNHVTRATNLVSMATSLVSMATGVLLGSRSGEVSKGHGLTSVSVVTTPKVTAKLVTIATTSVTSSVAVTTRPAGKTPAPVPAESRSASLTSPPLPILSTYKQPVSFTHPVILTPPTKHSSTTVPIATTVPMATTFSAGSRRETVVTATPPVAMTPMDALVSMVKVPKNIFPRRVAPVAMTTAPCSDIRISSVRSLSADDELPLVKEELPSDKVPGVTDVLTLSSAKQGDWTKTLTPPKTSPNVACSSAGSSTNATLPVLAQRKPSRDRQLFVVKSLDVISRTPSPVTQDSTGQIERSSVNSPITSVRTPVNSLTSVTPSVTIVSSLVTMPTTSLATYSIKKPDIFVKGIPPLQFPRASATPVNQVIAQPISVGTSKPPALINIPVSRVVSGPISVDLARSTALNVPIKVISRQLVKKKPPQTGNSPNET